MRAPSSLLLARSHLALPGAWLTPKQVMSVMWRPRVQSIRADGQVLGGSMCYELIRCLISNRFNMPPPRFRSLPSRCRTRPKRFTSRVFRVPNKRRSRVVSLCCCRLGKRAMHGGSGSHHACCQDSPIAQMANCLRLQSVMGRVS